MKFLDHHIIITGWVIFWTYWLLSAFGNKKNISSNFVKFTGIRIIIIIIVVALIAIGSHSIHLAYFNSYYFDAIGKVSIFIGFIMYILGLLLAVWARLYLGKNWGVPMSRKEEPEVVTSGPYSYIRHQIYTGILFALIGSALAGGIYWILILLIFAPYFIYSTIIEERMMIKQFPKVYSKYKNKTKMLIPFIF